MRKPEASLLHSHSGLVTAAPIRPAQSDAGSAEPGSVGSTIDRSWHVAEPALLVFRCACAARAGGWTRQVTRRELGVATSIAGVNMRLNAGGVRELHWHKASEWAYMLYGRARVTAVDSEGRYFVDDVGVGDLWFFPGGTPHSIQGLGPDGCEFLLVFDDGDFDEDNTFLLNDWFRRVPPEVLGKNFGVPAALFGHTPEESERCIFPRRYRGRSAPKPYRAHRRRRRTTRGG